MESIHRQTQKEAVKLMDSILNWHQEEKRCIAKLKKVDPDNPVLQVLFHSTYAACEAYWEALSQLETKKRPN